MAEYGRMHRWLECFSDIWPTYGVRHNRLKMAENIRLFSQAHKVNVWRSWKGWNHIWQLSTPCEEQHWKKCSTFTWLYQRRRIIASSGVRSVVAVSWYTTSHTQPLPVAVTSSIGRWCDEPEMSRRHMFDVTRVRISALHSCEAIHIMFQPRTRARRFWSISGCHTVVQTISRGFSLCDKPKTCLGLAIMAVWGLFGTTLDHFGPLWYHFGPL